MKGKIMQEFRIDCVIKPHRESTHEHITQVGGPNSVGGRWREPVETVIAHIESRLRRYYVDEGGKRVYVEVREGVSKRKFIQTRADGVWRNNLLALDNCR
ncbi:DUF3892 domain-containing protein [Methylosinus trichosporium]|uniref:DUF3892 domain-containing protein n=2 Tax=Methylocystaceae TaxID=31993 RepID=UPI0012FFF5CE|nr:DUF3892 domain-containing protein [Methylosinus trichosporium]